MDLEKELKDLKNRISKLEKTSNKMFGSSYSDVGSSSSDFLIKTRGKVKIQWGSKCIDLIKDGEINVDAKFIYKAEEIGSKDGIYVIGTGEEAQVTLVSGGQQIQLKGSDEGVTYVSFLDAQETTADQKYQALTNIGFIYPTLSDVPDFTSGIVYVEETQKLYVISNGAVSEYSFEFPNPYTDTFVIQKENNTQGALIIRGTGKGNSLAFNQMYIYSDSGKNYIDSDTDLLIRVNNEEKVTVAQGSATFKNKIVTPSIESTGATSSTGFKLYTNNQKTLLEVDSINVRDGLNIKMPCDIYSKYWYNEVNYIKLAESKSSDDSKYIRITLVNTNTFQVGDILCVYDDEGYKNLTVIEINQDKNRINVTDSSDSIRSSKLEQQSIFLIYRANGVNLLRRNVNNLDLIPISNVSEESDLTKINSRFGDLTELNLKGKSIDESGNVSNPSISGLGIYSNLACFKNVQYLSDYVLENNDNSSKLASTEWVWNKLNSLLPVGSIIMFGKKEIPDGWHICDGQEGTPNLINSFIKGGDISTLGNTGGNANSQITLTVENLPAHSHTYALYGGLSNASDHGDGWYEVSKNYDEVRNTSTVGEGKPFSVEPQYYTLIYIMKIK